MSLMCQMVADGEVDHLVAERVWQELSRGRMEAQPSRMFAVLRDCGALARLLPELDRLWGVPQSTEHHPEVDTGPFYRRAAGLRMRCPRPTGFSGRSLPAGRTAGTGATAGAFDCYRFNSC